MKRKKAIALAYIEQAKCNNGPVEFMLMGDVMNVVNILTHVKKKKAK